MSSEEQLETRVKFQLKSRKSGRGNSKFSKMKPTARNAGVLRTKDRNKVETKHKKRFENNSTSYITWL